MATSRTSDAHSDIALLEGTILSEGVVADSRPVSFAVRMLSGAIDAAASLLVMWALFVAVGAVQNLQGGLSEQAWAVLTVVIIVVVFVAAPTTIETLTRGRSLGKLAMGIRVVRDDGGPIRFRHALTRALTGVLELWMTGGSVALVVAFFNLKGKRLGDLLAGTYATRVRGGKVTTSPLIMPPELALWAHQADIRPLPSRYALAARQFLERAGRLTPHARADLGLRIAGLIEPFVAPGPPPGTHPESFIAAVLAERRDRDNFTAQRASEVSAARHATLQKLPFGLQSPRT